MEIFRSECDTERMLVVLDRFDDEFCFEAHGPEGILSMGFSMPREDAEAMARAMLGIPDPPLLNWEQCVADMRAQAALNALAEARRLRTASMA